MGHGNNTTAQTQPCAKRLAKDTQEGTDRADWHGKHATCYPSHHRCGRNSTGGMQRIDQYGKRGEQPPTPSLAEYRGGETDNKRHGPLAMSTLTIGVEMTKGPVPPTAILVGLTAEPDQLPSPNCPGSVTPHTPSTKGFPFSCRGAPLPSAATFQPRKWPESCGITVLLRPGWPSWQNPAGIFLTGALVPLDFMQELRRPPAYLPVFTESFCPLCLSRAPELERLSTDGFMLVLSRKKDESVVINDSIRIVVVEIRGDKVRLGVEAPKEVPVHRSEVYDAIARGEVPESCGAVKSCGSSDPQQPAGIASSDALEPPTADPVSE